VTGGDEFDFESVGVLQVGGVVVGTAGVGMAVGEQQDSAVVCRPGREGIDQVRIADPTWAMVLDRWCLGRL
jgi:hypothetical protein